MANGNYAEITKVSMLCAECQIVGLIKKEMYILAPVRTTQAPQMPKKEQLLSNGADILVEKEVDMSEIVRI